jgi:transposase
MPRAHASLQLSAAQQSQLRQWVAAHGTPQQVALRCRIVLAVAEGQSDIAMAAQFKTNRKTVMLRRRRFAQQGLDAWWRIAPGRGRKALYSLAKVQAVVAATLHSKPKGGTPWSCRSLAWQQAIGKSTVHNIWRSHNLKPHREKTFKLSRDARFLEKLPTWWDSISTRRSRRWCSVSRRRARFRPWTGRSPACP